jgi:hypothetical protein
MKNLFTGIALIVLFALACNDKKEAAVMTKSDNPLEELSWLKNMKDSLHDCACDMSIFEAKYNNEVVYFKMMNDPLCNSVFNITLRNYKGDVVKTYGYQDVIVFSEDVTDMEKLYTCSD